MCLDTFKNIIKIPSTGGVQTTESFRFHLHEHISLSESNVARNVNVFCMSARFSKYQSTLPEVYIYLSKQGSCLWLASCSHVFSVT